MIQKSLEASDLIEQRHGVALAALFEAFEQLVVQTWPRLTWRPCVPGTPVELARVMTSTALGFKRIARNVDELRTLLACQIALLDAFKVSI